MPTSDEKAFKASALDHTLSELAVTLDARDEEAIWRETREVLGWLYRLEEGDRATDIGYYQHRQASAEGRTLAGLIWVRGLVDHHAAIIRVLVWKRVTTYQSVNGEWVPTEQFMLRDGEWEPVEIHQATAEWPARGRLPIGKEERNGRDLLYDEFVAEKADSWPTSLCSGLPGQSASVSGEPSGSRRHVERCMLPLAVGGVGFGGDPVGAAAPGDFIARCDGRTELLGVIGIPLTGRVGRLLQDPGHAGTGPDVTDLKGLLGLPIVWSRLGQTWTN